MSSDEGRRTETAQRTLRLGRNVGSDRDDNRDELGEDTPRPTSFMKVMENAPDLSPVKRNRSKSTSHRCRSSGPRKVASLVALQEPITYIEVSPYDDTPDPPLVVSRVPAGSETARIPS